MAPFLAYFKSYDVYNSNLNIIIGVTTGITELSPDDIDGFDSGEIFDLNGRRVSKTVKGGIYIINGKKVIL
ncbi:MAG: hypothetical protein J6U89_08355 [Bacteroidaceae bacterium]|nr:hypothetical protein [Bacteroidaceae bacterium]